MTAGDLTDLPTDTRLRHIGLLYRDSDAYLRHTTSFVLDGLAAGEPVLLAVPEPRLTLVRGALGSDIAGVRFVDLAVIGRNPGRVIPEVLWSFCADHSDVPVRILTEPMWVARRDIEYPACLAHEALVNVVFATRDATILCPYDATGLGDTAVADAAKTHPLLMRADELHRSPDYRDPAVDPAGYGRPLPAPPATAASLPFADEGALHRVRQFVAEYAAGTPLPAERVDDLCLAVNELAANSCEHGLAPRRLSIWTEPASLVCQVEDAGLLADPLVGRIPPGPTSFRGRGLLMVNALCDLVLIHSRPGCTAVRLQMDW